MFHSDQIELVGESSVSTNDYGDPVIDKTYTSVFADKMAVNEKEFYQANAQGLKPELKFKLRSVEYNAETQIRYPVTTGKHYDVIRTYDKGGEFVEITCQGVVADADA